MSNPQNTTTGKHEPADYTYSQRENQDLLNKVNVTGKEEEKRLSGFRILLAEDEPINQTLATALLEKLGTSVTAVANGREALTEVTSNPYDLALMDLQMPELDGFDTTKAIRSLKGHK